MLMLLSPVPHGWFRGLRMFDLLPHCHWMSVIHGCPPSVIRPSLLLLPVLGTVCPNMSRPHPLCLFSDVVPRLSSSGVPSRDFHRDICSDCAVTVVTFGHFNHSFLLTYIDLPFYFTSQQRFTERRLCKCVGKFESRTLIVFIFLGQLQRHLMNDFIMHTKALGTYLTYLHTLLSHVTTSFHCVYVSANFRLAISMLRHAMSSDKWLQSAHQGRSPVVLSPSMSFNWWCFLYPLSIWTLLCCASEVSFYGIQNKQPIPPTA